MKQLYLICTILFCPILVFTNKVYIGNYDNNTVSVFDTVSNTVSGLVNDSNNTFNEIYFIVISPDGLTGYVANYTGTISIIDIATDTVTGVITTPGTSLYSMNITPDGKKLYVIQDGAVPILIIDIKTKSFVGNVDANGFTLDVPYFMTITPDGSRAYIADYGQTGDPGRVLIMDVATNKIIGLVSDPNDTIEGPFALTVTPDGKSVYVGNFDTNTVGIIDVATNVVTDLISHPLFDTIYDIKSSDTQVYVDSFVDPGTNNIIHVIDQKTKNVFYIITEPIVDDFYYMALTSDYKTMYVPCYHPYQQLNDSKVGIINLQTNNLQGLVQDPQKTFDGSSVIAIVPSPYAATKVTGFNVCNLFLTQSDSVNIISWSPSSSMGPQPIKYSVYRDVFLTDLVGTVSSNDILRIEDHNRKKNKTYIYYVVAVDQFDNVSTPVSVAITTKCC
ncbi:YncE family protein [Candidatus Dependentiae bacterium]|nr:YncE family protein [Candidatus Dependentiae bacterium]